MKKDRYRNRKYIFQIMDNKSFKWYDIFTAVDEEDMLEQLKMVYTYSDNDDQYRILKNNNGYESVLTFIHGRKDIEMFLEKMYEALSSNNKKEKTFQDDYIFNIYNVYYKNEEDSKNNICDIKKSRKIDSIDSEIFEMQKEDTQNEEEKIVEDIKKLTFGRYVV